MSSLIYTPELVADGRRIGVLPPPPSDGGQFDSDALAAVVEKLALGHRMKREADAEISRMAKENGWPRKGRGRFVGDEQTHPLGPERVDFSRGDPLEEVVAWLRMKGNQIYRSALNERLSKRDRESLVDMAQDTFDWANAIERGDYLKEI